MALLIALIVLLAVVLLLKSCSNLQIPIPVIAVITGITLAVFEFVTRAHILTALLVFVSAAIFIVFPFRRLR
jgi:hypothetical protein